MPEWQPDKEARPRKGKKLRCGISLFHSAGPMIVHTVKSSWKKETA